MYMMNLKIFVISSNVAKSVIYAHHICNMTERSVAHLRSVQLHDGRK